MFKRATFVLLLSLCACSSGPSERDEARALLEQLLRLDPGAAAAERAREIDALDALPLLRPELQEVRRLCSDVHRGLLKAEARQFAARQALDAAERTPRDGGIAPEQARHIADEIRGSEAELSHAAQGLPECQERLRALTVRFR